MEAFIKDTRWTAKQHGIKIRLPKTKTVKCRRDSIPSSGYFDSGDMIISVAKNGDAWLGVLVHESCHMDQWIENRVQWEMMGVGFDMFYRWLNRKIELSDAELQSAFLCLIACELDCEKRTLAKIKKYGLEVNIKEYARVANHCLYAYTAIKNARRWDNAFFAIKGGTRKVPTKLRPFAEDYLTVPSYLQKSFTQK